MGGIFGGGGGGGGANDEALKLQRETIDQNNKQLQAKVNAFSALRLGVIKSQGSGTYNDRTINT